MFALSAPCTPGYSQKPGHAAGPPTSCATSVAQSGQAHRQIGAKPCHEQTWFAPHDLSSSPMSAARHGHCVQHAGAHQRLGWRRPWCCRAGRAWCASRADSRLPRPRLRRPARRGAERQHRGAFHILSEGHTGSIFCCKAPPGHAKDAPRPAGAGRHGARPAKAAASAAVCCSAAAPPSPDAPAAPSSSAPAPARAASMRRAPGAGCSSLSGGTRARALRAAELTQRAALSCSAAACARVSCQSRRPVHSCAPHARPDAAGAPHRRWQGSDTRPAHAAALAKLTGGVTPQGAPHRLGTEPCRMLGSPVRAKCCAYADTLRALGGPEPQRAWAIAAAAAPPAAPCAAAGAAAPPNTPAADASAPAALQRPPSALRMRVSSAPSISPGWKVCGW